ncbi:hypothetical protein [Streptomyces bacillaris]|uniref:hypothetical protein n=1 Tax=Streptomyces bacillaris TaxID=68179 RepID=UPI003645A24F
MTITGSVTGIAAVLDQPMRDRPIIFTRPSPFLSIPGAPVLHNGKRVGDVLKVWVDGTLVRWEGHLPPPTFTWEDTPDDLRVPQFDPPVVYLVAEGFLVGLTDLVQGRMETCASGTVVSDWAVAGITLLPYKGRPWPELHLAPAR